MARTALSAILTFVCSWTAKGHGGLTKPMPRKLDGREYCPWCIGEHVPSTNPFGGVYHDAQLSHPCGGTKPGDPHYTSDRYGGFYADTGPAAATYVAGGTLSAKIVLDADHGGEAQWSYCPQSMQQTEECFKSHTITGWEDVRSYWGKDSSTPEPAFHDHVFPQNVSLPSDMPTGPVTLRWLWVCKWTDEIFVSCLDTKITGGNGDGSPESRPNPIPVPTPLPAPPVSNPESAVEGKCIWTDPPNVEVKRTLQKPSPLFKKCWTYTVEPGTTVYIQSKTDIYTSWNADVCCVSAAPSYGSAADGEPNVVAFTPKFGEFGFCECLKWDPASIGASCAGQARAVNMKCPVFGATGGMCPEGEQGSAMDHLPISCTGPYAPEKSKPQPNPESNPEPNAECSGADADRYWPNLGGCCAGLQQVEEERPSNDYVYCAESDPKHGDSCWSTITMCRVISPSPTASPTTSSTTTPSSIQPTRRPTPYPAPSTAPTAYPTPHWPRPTPSTTPPLARVSQCGTTNAGDCQRVFKNAKNQGNIEAFCNRCANEGGSNPLRKRCRLCCDECNPEKLQSAEGTVGGLERRSLRVHRPYSGDQVLLQSDQFLDHAIEL